MNIEVAINVINTWIEPMRRTMKGTLSQEFINAAEVLKNNAIRYRWHDVRKDPADLPEGRFVLLFVMNRDGDFGVYSMADSLETCKRRVQEIEAEYGPQGWEIKAWRELEQFEEG